MVPPLVRASDHHCTVLRQRSNLFPPEAARLLFAAMKADPSSIHTLRGIEVALGVRYPQSFHAGLHELLELTHSVGFARALPSTRLLLDVADVHSARQHAGGRLLPFMLTEREQPDVYAFEPDRGDAEPAVVVWCVHTVVHEWKDFPAFMRWARDLCNPPGRMRE